MSKETSGRMLSVGEVAKRAGVAVSAIHFYETKGLITSLRNSGNQRRYTSGVLRFIGIIKVAQRVGIPLEEIREVLGQYQSGTKITQEQWSVAAQKWKKTLNQRIRTLESLRDEFDKCIGCGCLSLEDCPLRNPDDVLGKEGSGARLLEDPDAPVSLPPQRKKADTD